MEDTISKREAEALAAIMVKAADRELRILELPYIEPQEPDFQGFLGPPRDDLPRTFRAIADALEDKPAPTAAEVTAAMDKMRGRVSEEQPMPCYWQKFTRDTQEACLSQALHDGSINDYLKPEYRIRPVDLNKVVTEPGPEKVEDDLPGPYYRAQLVTEKRKLPGGVWAFNGDFLVALRESHSICFLALAEAGVIFDHGPGDHGDHLVQLAADAKPYKLGPWFEMTSQKDAAAKLKAHFDELFTPVEAPDFDRVVTAP